MVAISEAGPSRHMNSSVAASICSATIRLVRFDTGSALDASDASSTGWKASLDRVEPLRRAIRMYSGVSSTIAASRLSTVVTSAARTHSERTQAMSHRDPLGGGVEEADPAEHHRQWNRQQQERQRRVELSHGVERLVGIEQSGHKTNGDRHRHRHPRPDPRVQDEQRHDGHRMSTTSHTGRHSTGGTAPDAGSA